MFDFLALFVTDDLLEMIVQESNIYAAEFIAARSEEEVAQHPHSRVNEWKAVTVGELKNFFALLFLTGLVRKPELQYYWSTDDPVLTPFFGKNMSRNRFQIIWRFLHFTNNKADAAAAAAAAAAAEAAGEVFVPDRLCKINPVLLYLTEKFKEMFIPSRNINQIRMQGSTSLSFWIGWCCWCFSADCREETTK